MWPSRVTKHPPIKLTTLFIALTVAFWFTFQPLAAAPLFQSDSDTEDLTDEVIEEPAAPEQVDIQPLARDEEIAERLQSILLATEWFVAPEVDVQDGVVFLSGRTEREEWREWASTLANNTQDVAAVVNRIEIIPRPLWDFAPAWTELRTLWRESIQALPLIVFGMLLLVLTWLLTGVAYRIARRFVQERLPSPLLINVVAWLIAAPVLISGIYVVLRIAGLTQLALTVLGGTGLAGLIIGIAFRDIAENFLASILISIRNPFRAGDRVDLAGFTGIVERVTTRGTVLMTLDGNHVQIPNSTVYKSTITNYTANPSRRMDFVVGIGYETVIHDAQSAISQVLAEHPAVMDDPKPLVLVEELGASTINLRAYFWFNGSQYEGQRLKSSLIRLAKRTLDDKGISMPDEAREVIFPQGVPVIGQSIAGQAVIDQSQIEQSAEGTAAEPSTMDQSSVEALISSQPSQDLETSASLPDPLTTDAEGGLQSEDAQIQEQARQSRSPEEGEDLLDTSDSPRE